MDDKDTGNMVTQTMYELATQPIFVDRSQEIEKEISWEVSGGEDDEPAGIPDEVKEEVVPPEVKEEASEEEQTPPQAESEDDEDIEPKEKKKKKNRLSERSRIAQLTRELRQAQAVAHDVLSRNQYLESKISQKEKEVFTTEENYLLAQKERAKKYLAEAIEEGDPTKIAEGNDLLSQYNAKILFLNEQKQSLQAPAPQQNYYPRNSPQPVYEEPIDVPYKEEGREWIEKNPWADEKSRYFDKTLYDVADNYSLFLANKYELEGRKHEIGSKDFFDEITDYIENSYDIPTQSPPSKPQPRNRMQMKTDQSPPVGAVTRQAPSNQPPLKAKDIVLTPEQKEIAYSLRGFVRDPKTGQKVQDNKTLEEIYKRNLMRGNG